MAKYKKPSQKAIALSYQWRASIQQTLRDIEKGKTTEYSTTLKDMRLTTLLLCLAHHRQKEVHSIIEDLLIRQLSKDSVYKRYFDNKNFNVRIATTTAIEFQKNEPAILPKDQLKDDNIRY